ncbi:MAG: hypothetical protein AAB699_03635 [Patescibacteria group bacterium]
MRILLDIALFLSVIYAPWWIVFLLGSVLFFAFPRFYEFSLSAWFLDILYGASPRFGSFPFPMLSAALVLTAAFLFLRRHIRNARDS